MEKEILEINVNGRTQDCIVSYCMEAVRDDDNKIIYVNESDKVAKTKGKIDEITLYVQDNNDCDKFSAVKLTSYGIKKLYASILEIEQKTGEDVCYDMIF